MTDQPRPATEANLPDSPPRRLREPAERAAQLWREGQAEAGLAAQRELIDRLAEAVGPAAEPTLAARLVLAGWLADRALARLADGRPLLALRQDIERRGTGLIDIDGFETGLVTVFADLSDLLADLIAQADQALGPEHAVTRRARDLLERVDEHNVPELAAQMAAEAIDQLLEQTRRAVVDRMRALSRRQARREAQTTLSQRQREAATAVTERGCDDPVTLQAQYRLVWDLTHCGEGETALSLAEDVLERCRRILGDDHTDTVRARYAIACLHGDRDEFDQAIAELEEIVADFARIDGPAQATTLTARRVQADFVGFQGDYWRATELAAGLLHDAQELGAAPEAVEEAEAAAALWLRLA